VTGQSEHAYNSGPGTHGGSQREQASLVSRFSFLSTAQADLRKEILARRSSTLLERVRQANSVDAEEIMSVISNEVTENLDDKWEPTDYGQAVSALLAQFNSARVNEWP